MSPQDTILFRKPLIFGLFRAFPAFFSLVVSALGNGSNGDGGDEGHDRVVPLSRVACKFLETYLKGIRPQLVGGKATDKLFVSMRGNPIDAHTVGDVVKKYARLAN